MDWSFFDVELEPLWRPHLAWFNISKRSLQVPLYYRHQAPSSQTWADEQLSQTPLPHGATFVAGGQSQGLGRQHQPFYTPQDRGLYMTQWLELPANCNPAGFSLVAALGICWLCARLGMHQVRWKWPNDIMVCDRKLAGLLPWFRSNATQEGLLLGIGLNGLPLPKIYQDRLQSHTQATSLWQGCHPVNQQRLEKPGWPLILAYHVACTMLHLIPYYKKRQLRPFLPLLEQLDGLRGRSIQGQGSEGRIQGTAMGIDPQGALLIATTQGQIHTCHSGAVQQLRGQGAKTDLRPLSSGEQ